jgi:hypothetical protein
MWKWRIGVEFDDVSRAYIIAGLRVGQDVDGFVDAYYGPSELRDEAAACESVDAAVDAAEDAILGLEDGPRKQFFVGQLRAMREVLEPSPGYLDSVERTYGIRPAKVDESMFGAARATLDGLLDGSGSLVKRLSAFRRRYEVAPDRALSIAGGLAGELRRRTLEFIDLPEGERAEIALVSDKPWSGYNWYLGGLVSRIEINTDLPILALDLPELVAHEMYCGHHTEQVVKEARWTIKRGWGEASIVLLHTPQALISEGIATIALDVLVDRDERANWLHEHCFGQARLDVTAAESEELRTALDALGRAANNADLMIHLESQSQDRAVDYLIETAAMEPERARQMVRFITAPGPSGYIFNYSEGHDRISAFLAASRDPMETYRRLLQEHWTPSMLTGAGSREVASHSN